MKIVHVSFSDSVGGAAIAAFRLHEAMLERGLDSEMIVYENKRKNSKVYPIYKSGLFSYVYKLSFLLIGDKSFKRIKDRGHYSFFSRKNIFKEKNRLLNADIIFLHWINRGVISYSDVKHLLRTGKEVIWVMHDMFPITGGCHHSFECKRYEDDCLGCPMYSKGSRIASKQLRMKEKLTRYTNMYWVAPSKWLYQCALNSRAVNRDRLYCIPNVISKSFFQINKEFSREALGLDSNKKYILFGADGVESNPYKGFNYFIDVINKLNASSADFGDTEVMVFGEADLEYITEKIVLPLNYMGNVTDERTMNLIYNAANIYVVTSIAENYPLTIQESIYCGTKVIAFNVGGISSLIDCDDKGKLISKYDTTYMKDAIIEVLTEDIQTQRFRAETREIERTRIIDSYFEIFKCNERESTR